MASKTTTSSGVLLSAPYGTQSVPNVDVWLHTADSTEFDQALNASETVSSQLFWNSHFRHISALIQSDQSGTLYLDESETNSYWFLGTTSITVTANTPAKLQAPLMSQYARLRFVNNSTAATRVVLVARRTTV